MVLLEKVSCMTCMGYQLLCTKVSLMTSLKETLNVAVELQYSSCVVFKVSLLDRIYSPQALCA